MNTTSDRAKEAVRRIKLGLDIGVASIGFSLLEWDGTSFKRIAYGVRMFGEAQTAEERRAYRSIRRGISRKKARKRSIRHLLNFHTVPLLDTCPYKLRKEGLERLLTKEELCRALYNIAVRRGYSSTSMEDTVNEKAGAKDGVKEGLKKFNEAFKDSGYETVGAYLYDQRIKRNKGGEYRLMVYADMLAEEISKIFAKQRGFGSDITTIELEEACKDAIFFKRPLKSNYPMIGYCTLEPAEKRAPKDSYSGELFVTLNTLVNETILDPLDDYAERRLTADEVQGLVKLAEEKVEKKKTNVKCGLITYKEAKEFLGSSDITISSQAIKQAKDSDIYISFKNSTTLKYLIKTECGEEFYNSLQDVNKTIDDVAFSIVCEKDKKELTKRMKKYEVPEEVINCVLNNYIPMKKVLNLSCKAIRNVAPYMLNGSFYYDACIAAGYGMTTKKRVKDGEYVWKIPPINPDELPAPPGVQRALSQTLKVINSLLRKYGRIDDIYIETANCMAYSKSGKEEIALKQSRVLKFKQEVTSEYAKRFKEELGVTIKVDEKAKIFENKGLLEKCILHKEQDGRSMYSAKPITLQDLLTRDMLEIDHIIPRAVNYSNSRSNKCLIFKTENFKKLKNTLYEYFQLQYSSNFEEEWKKFVARVKGLNICHTKFLNLTTKELDVSGFRDRQLNETSYINKFLKNYLEENTNGVNIETRSGDFINYLKAIWDAYDKTNKTTLTGGKDRENHRHHAVDATIIACSKNWMVEDVTNKVQFFSDKFDIADEKERRKQIKKALGTNIAHSWEKIRYNLPWPSFVDDMAAIYDGRDKIHISWQEIKRQRGILHGETIRSCKGVPEGKSCYKIKLTSLSATTINLLRDGNFEQVIPNFADDLKVCNKVRARILMFEKGTKAEVIFAEPLIKGGKNGNEIKGIRVLGDASGIPMRGGITTMTANGKSCTWKLEIYSRVDEKGNKCYGGIPIYKINATKDNREVIFSRTKKFDKSECKYEMTLYPNTPIEIIDGKGNKVRGRYSYYDIACNSMALKALDTNEIIARLSILSCKVIKITSKELC